jgi:hypothetical protein
MNEQETAEQNENCQESLEIEDVQADETANIGEVQTDCELKVSETKTEALKESKELRICRLFVTWPKLFFGKLYLDDIASMT